MGIIDIVLIALIVIALGIGAYKGLAGLLLGFLGTLIITVVLGVVVGYATPVFMYQDPQQGVVTESETMGYTDIFYKIYSRVSPNFVDTDNTLYDTEFVQNGDSLGVVVEDEEGDPHVLSFDEYLLQGLSDTPYGQYLTGIGSFVSIFTKYGTAGLTVGHSISAFISSLVLGAILWFIGSFVFLIIKLIVKHFVYKTLDSHGALSKIDRAIGAVIAVVVIVAISWTAFSFVDANKLAWGIGEDVDAYIANNRSLEIMSQNNLFKIFSGADSGSGEPAVEAASAIANGFVYRPY